METKLTRDSINKFRYKNKIDRMDSLNNLLD